MRCDVCGTIMASSTTGYECPICGHKVDCYSDSIKSTSSDEKICPICGNKLEMTTEQGVTQSCSSCGYEVKTYIGDPPKYNQYIPDTNSLVNEPDNKPGGLYGWICPKCGAALSPFIDCCPHCTQRNWTFIY